MAIQPITETTTETAPNHPAANDERLFPRLSPEQQTTAAQYGVCVHLNPGDVLFAEGEASDGTYIVTDGEIKVTRDVAGADTLLVIHQAGEFTGELGALTGGTNIATARAIGASSVVRLDRAAFEKLLENETEIRNLIVPAMVQRRPEADRMVQEREKLAALGRMAAGLAHEVNNPAAAARSAVQELSRNLNGLLETVLKVGTHGLKDAQADALAAFSAAMTAERPAVIGLDPLARGDRENEIADWLEAQTVDEPWELAPRLVEAGATLPALDTLGASVTGAALCDSLGYLAASTEAALLIAQIEEATGRIVNLVQTVKEYSYMDQAPRQEVDVNAGLRTTLSLFHQLSKENIEIVTDLSPCPPISAFGSELNQVWTNLLVNAADAIRTRREGEGEAATPGKIAVHTRCEFDQVLVSIEDNGTGIPPENLPHLFEPFFTTKAPGKGTGLGLDISHRIVVDHHHGDLQVRSEPGMTRFEVRLPTRLANTLT